MTTPTIPQPGFVGTFTAAQLATMNPANYALQTAFVYTGTVAPYGYFVESDGLTWYQRFTYNSSTQAGQAGGAAITLSGGSGGGGSSVPGAYNVTAAAFANFLQGFALADAPNQGAVPIDFYYDSNGITRPGGNNAYLCDARVIALLQQNDIIYNAQAQPSQVWTLDNATNYGNSLGATTLTHTGTWTNANRGPFEQFGITTIVNASSITIPQVNTGYGRYLCKTGASNGTVTNTTTSSGPFTARSLAGAEGFAYFDDNGGDGGITLSKSDATANPVTIFVYEKPRGLSGSTFPSGSIRKDLALGIKGSRFAVAGMKMGDLALNTNGSGSLSFLAFRQSRLAVIDLVTNDGNTQTSLASFTASATSIASTLKSVFTDVLFTVGTPYASDATNAIKMTQYVAALKAVCDANNCGLMDYSSYFGTFAQALAAGLMDNSDGLGLHLAPAGVTLRAQLTSKALKIFI